MTTPTHEALARTALLVRREIIPTAPEDKVVETLTRRRVRLRADARNVESPAGQAALIATAILIAQLGARIDLQCPDVSLVGAQPPLASSSSLRQGLMGLLADLIMAPGPAIDPDVTILLGDTPPTIADAGRVLRLSGDGWHADLRSARSDGTRWDGNVPFGPVLAGVAAAGEVFRMSMRELADQYPASGRHDLDAAPHVSLGVRPFAPVLPALGAVDIISAGAITNAALFTLFRLPGGTARARVFDGDLGALGNLNRYLLLRRSVLGQPKVDVLADLAPPGWELDPVAQLYDDALASEVHLTGLVLVGVDDIPSRWRAQAHAPGWLCVAGTSGTDVVVSEHDCGTACAGCLHPYDDPTDGAIATVSFVSALAGVLQAYRLGRRASSAERLAPVLAYGFSLPAPLALVNLGQPGHPACPVGCPAARAAAA